MDEEAGFASQDEVTSWWDNLDEVDRVRWVVSWQGRKPDGTIQPEPELLATLPAGAAKPGSGETYTPDPQFASFLDARVEA